MDALIGIDVGTGSARAGVFTDAGRMLGQASRPIRNWRPLPGHVQQSTTDIWAAICAATQAALAAAGPVTVRGIGFDATCSMVVLDADGAPLPVGEPSAAGPAQDVLAQGVPAQDVPVQDVPVQDVIVWMDHRALAETEAINAGDHAVLRYVGGRISPEMETPKLLWLNRHLPDIWRRAAHFFDLPDFLTWRATGSLSRSLCSTVCKWTYLGHEGRWDAGYFTAIGLGDLVEDGFRRIGTEIVPMGERLGGLTAQAAAELGLPEGTPVGASAIDAHAGGLGVIGAALADGPPDDAALRRRMALIGGTSSCHMAVSAEPNFVPGVWGPYYAAMIPGLWLNEGGQSATGSLIDHVVQTHAAYPAMNEAAGRQGQTIYQALNARLEVLAADAPFPAALTRALHVMPDFHGNRSPRADPSLHGMISGLRLEAGADDLALLYLATIQAVAYGTRHIIETMNLNGAAIDTILATGGGTRNPVFLREHADACHCAIVLPAEQEAVLLGAAILGAVASGVHADLRAAMAAMSRAGATIAPADGAVAAYHDAKFAVFQKMYDDQMAYRDLMAGTA